MKFSIPLSILFGFYLVQQNTAVPFFTHASNVAFAFAFVHLMIGFIIFVRNGALFKSVRFFLYRRETLKIKNAGMKDDPNFENPMNFEEFVTQKYGKKHPNKNYLIFGTICLTLSIVFAMFF